MDPFSSSAPARDASGAVLPAEAMLAAIVFGDGEPIDERLFEIVSALRAAGRQVAGVRQHAMREAGRCCPSHHVELLSDGTITTLSQDLGKASHGCRLDERALTEVVQSLLQALEKRPDIVVLNRFGRSESTGHGMRAIIERACELGIPVLTGVRENYLGDWRAYAGPLAYEARIDTPAILCWALHRTEAHDPQAHSRATTPC